MTDYSSTKSKAEAGDVSAMAETATALYSGSGVTQDFNEAFRWFSSAADAGNVWARYMLGVMCQEGQGTAQDPEKAFQHYFEAAQTGHPLSNLALGVLCQTGMGTPTDHPKALEYYRVAAEADNANAAKNLGSMIHLGMGLDQPDLDEALIWYKKARELGATGTETYINQIEAQLNPEAAAITAIREFRAKPASLWDRLIGRR